MPNLLLFTKTIKLETLLSEDEFLDGVARNSNGDERTEGDIFENGFHMIYSSNFALPFKNPLPAIEVIGQTSNNGTKTEVDIKINLSPLPRNIFLIAFGTVILTYFLGKFGISPTQGMSDNIFSLFVIPFGYVFLLFLYLFESRSCEEHFKTMIKFIERENKNEL